MRPSASIPKWTWDAIEWLLRHNHTVTSIVKTFKPTFPLLSPGVIYWHNQNVFKLQLNCGVRRGDRCATCRKREVFMWYRCRSCYLECRMSKRKWRRSAKGSAHWAWKGGKTSEARTLKNSKEYKQWRFSVFTRDDYTCQSCGARGGYLHAHHIKPKTLFPALMFLVSNGQTLCVPCHRKTDTYGPRVHAIGKEAVTP